MPKTHTFIPEKPNLDQHHIKKKNPKKVAALIATYFYNCGSAPLGFYTPMKAPIDKLFQLGVTRAPSLEPTTNGGSSNLLINGMGSSGGSIVCISKGLIEDDDSGEQEPESLQYIKPADDDDLNMAYSEGTQKTDLLY
uniref:Uncharacterized protein n=1 Tax=Stomoxys calcitrans TaxID=35570 RepID=A0A1I8P6A6_STOCA